MTTQAGRNKKLVMFNIYVTTLTKKEVIDLRNLIKKLWWNKYNSTITYAEMVYKALLNLKEGLEKKSDELGAMEVRQSDIKRQNLYKYERVRF
jgi:hypothetical protein